jgi:hypothetical protein
MYFTYLLTLLILLSAETAVEDSFCVAEELVTLINSCIYPPQTLTARTAGVIFVASTYIDLLLKLIRQFSQ